MSTITSTIGGTTRHLLLSSVQHSAMLGERDRVSARIYGVRPSVPSALILSVGGVARFGGTIVTTKEGDDGEGRAFVKLDAISWEAILDKTPVTETYNEGTTHKAVVTDLVTTYLAPHGFTLAAGMPTGPSLPKLEYNRRPLGDVFRELMQLATSTFLISPTKVISWEAAGTSVAPATVSDATVVGSIGVERSAADYANHIIVLAGDQKDPVVGEASDAAEIAAKGRYTDIYEAPASWNQGTANALAAEILLVRKNTVVGVNWATKVAGFAKGQRVTLSSTARALASADYLIQQVTLRETEGNITYSIEAKSLLHAVESYLDQYRKWSPSSAVSAAPSSTPGRVNPTVYPICLDGLTGVRSATPDWTEVSHGYPARLDGADWSGRVVTAFVRVRAFKDNVAVTPRIRNKTTGAVAGIGALVSQAWYSGGAEVWSELQAITVTVASGVNEYALELLPGASNEYVYGQARIEAR